MCLYRIETRRAKNIQSNYIFKKEQKRDNEIILKMLEEFLIEINQEV